MQRSDAGRPGEWSLEEREWDVPAWFWSNFIDLEVEDWNDWNNSPHNWHRGVFAGQGNSPTGACWVALTGTHYHVEALQALYPSGGQPSVTSGTSPDPRPPPGGRPPASFWDDLWCSVWGQISRGDLKPKLQADVEKAMLQWVSAHGHEPSDSTIATPRSEAVSGTARRGRKLRCWVVSAPFRPFPADRDRECPDALPDARWHSPATRNWGDGPWKRWRYPSMTRRGCLGWAARPFTP